MVAPSWIALSMIAAVVLAGCAGDAPNEDATSSSTSTTDAPSSDTNTTTSPPPASNATNQAPVIGDFSTNRTGLDVLFTFQASDADGDALTFALSFGDGSSNQTGALTDGVGNATHTFPAAGAYNVTLTVLDGQDADERTLRLNITAEAVATGAAAQDYSCSVTAGTAGFTLTGSPVGDLGYCPYVVLTATSVLQAEQNASGCTTYVDTDPNDTSGGSAATVGETYEAGFELGMRCPLPGGAAGGDGTITIVAV